MRGLTREELKALLLSVGTHRKERNRSPAEVAQLLQKAIDGGETRKRCADFLQLGTTQVSQFLRLLQLAPEIQHLADWGGTADSAISFSSLAQLAPLKPADQVRAAKAILEHRLTWKEVVQLTQIADRSRKSIEECIHAVVKLRPEVETKHLFIGSVNSEYLKTSLAVLAQHKRDELMQRVLRRLLGATADASGRLGAKNFTIVSDRNPVETLNMTADAFERAVNDELLQASGPP